MSNPTQTHPNATKTATWGSAGAVAAYFGSKYLYDFGGDRNILVYSLAVTWLVTARIFVGRVGLRGGWPRLVDGGG